MKNSKIKTVCKLILIAIAVLILVYNLIYVTCETFELKFSPSIFGKQIYIMEDNSMSPELQKYDMVFIEKCNEQDIKIGDIVAFYENNSMKIERILEKTGDYYTTKTDNSYYVFRRWSLY